MSRRKGATRIAAGARGNERSRETYGQLLSDVSQLLELGRLGAARSVNAFLTATYWQVGRRIVEHEQHGRRRAGYGEGLLERLAEDLTARHGRGFSRANLQQTRLLYLGWQICQTPSGKFEARVTAPALPGRAAKRQTPSGKSRKVSLARANHIAVLAGAFPLSWSHYVRLMSVTEPLARAFYEAEAIRGGWSVRQLDRQIGTQFYERAVRSKSPAAMVARAIAPRPGGRETVDVQVRDPYMLEFLNLKDEYSESDLEDALIRHLESFLLELGAGFTFVARQKRLRVGNTWYRMDLLLYHRSLRCLVVIDLKAGMFTHADAGQMNLYLNYAKEHLSLPGENEPVGIILCSDKDDAVVRYATGGIRARVFASKYLTLLPDEETLRQEIMTTRRALRAASRPI
jgi:predicted nuclease of restriction endonuclease-like (RecB) superfamily